MERSRHEIIDEYFFEMPIWDSSGSMVSAPPEALAKYEELKNGWLKDQPQSAIEKPAVALYPLFSGPKQGYIVATQIVYKPSSIPEED